MAEIWDLYTQDEQLSGLQIERERKAEIPEGLYHLSSETLIRHVDGSYLCMLRAASKKDYPLCWEMGAGGAAQAGEDALTCIRRELREETGICWDDFVQIGRVVKPRGHDIIYTYLCTVDWPKENITLQKGETEGFRWMSEEEFVSFIRSGKAIAPQLERCMEYFCRMGYM